MDKGDDREWNSLIDWNVIHLNCQQCGKKVGFSNDEPEYRDDFEGLILCFDCTWELDQDD